MIVAGLGCRPGVRAQNIVACIRHAEEKGGGKASLLAIPFFRATEPALFLATKQLGMRLSIVEAQALSGVQHLCPTRSELALKATGFASVAEGCALAAAGGADALLLVSRQTGDGVTCALAVDRAMMPATAEET